MDSTWAWGGEDAIEGIVVHLREEDGKLEVVQQRCKNGSPGRGQGRKSRTSSVSTGGWQKASRPACWLRSPRCACWACVTRCRCCRYCCGRLPGRRFGWCWFRCRNGRRGMSVMRPGLRYLRFRWWCLCTRQCRGATSFGDMCGRMGRGWDSRLRADSALR